MAKAPHMVAMKSTNVGAIGYDADGLHVTFKGGIRYVYEGVPLEVYHQALAADSIGKFIAENIKGRYAFKKLENA